MAPRNLGKWELLLDNFREFVNLEDKIFDLYPSDYVENLYERISDHGFKLSPPEDIDPVQHSTQVRKAVKYMFSSLMDIGPERAELGCELSHSAGITYWLDLRGGANRARKVQTESMPVVVATGIDADYGFDLGNAGENGIVFVFKFAMMACGIRHVNSCKVCHNFFFSKRTDAFYCNTTCGDKYRYNRRKK